MKTRKMKILCLVLTAVLVVGIALPQSPHTKAANSYLPHWEHIPDGEPRLFEDPDNPGKYRAYIYGSHDTRRNGYCGKDLVTWSAPAEDLNDWRYDGKIFESIVNGSADVLYAPDVVETKDENGEKVYYLYPNNRGDGRGSMIAKSKRPDGPFEVCNWKEGSTTKTEGDIGYDPAVFVDDDGRVYAYWGFEASNMAEIDPETMCTVKKGCKVLTEKDTGIDGKGGDTFRFFEASSMRKVGDKYVFVYSRTTLPKEFGLDTTNATLAYAYGDTPLGPWTYGGTIIDARARDTDERGKTVATVQSGNTHGSILEVNGQWYVFYHRCINNDQYSRQSMVEPIDVEVTEDGRVVISEAEVTSQGFETDGLNPYKMQTAGCACFMLHGPYIKAHWDETNPGSDVSGIKKGSVVGFKYLNFDKGKGTRDKKMISVEMIPKGIDGTMKIMLDRPWESDDGIEIGEIQISASDEQKSIVKSTEIESLDEISGTHALYFVFEASTARSEICDLRAFQFGDSTVTREDEGQDLEPVATPGVTEQATPVPSATVTPTVLPTSEPAQTTAPVITPTPAPAGDAKDTGKVESGSSKVGDFTYVVKDDGKSAILTKTNNKKLKTITIPPTVTINGKKIKVSVIGKNAFKGSKVATRVVIGKNITEIQKGAFQSCGKVKKVDIKTSNLKKVGKNAFKGINKKATFKVPNKQVTKYKKLLGSSQGVKKSMKIK